MIKRIYKDFIIAFLNSRGEIPFTFEGAVKGRNTVKSTFKSNIDIFLVFSHKHGFCQSDSFFREFQRDDINKVADIWLDTNIKAHNFIPAEYWKSNFRSVKKRCY